MILSLKYLCKKKLNKYYRKNLIGLSMHKKIMKKAATALLKDAKHYASDAKHAHSSTKKKHDKVEMKEAVSAAKDLKKRAKKAHEY